MPRDDDPETALTLPLLPARAAPPTTQPTEQQRYVLGRELGAGGMGEVRLCEDKRCGREVAMKVARDPLLHERFIYEARIQAQLEHPSIVPVYDIGTHEGGAPYFTMKRVHGVTLRQVLLDLSRGEPQATATFTRRRLLTAFASVCLTVQYAHTHGVLHRDLKPSNVMLGEYGELYVLDWGVARAEGAKDETPIRLRLPDKGDDTTPGDFVGTPGYIAPEHLRGSPIDARADIYSLGAILFEILALEPLHPRGPVQAVHATLNAIDTHASQRLRAGTKDVPPELEAICLRATSTNPKDRYQTAKELHDAVDGYLEGDRDVERRRQSSAEHAASAEELAGRSRRARKPDEETELRSRALGEVSRALALDTANEGARRVLVNLMTEPPRAIPREALVALDRSRHGQMQTVARGAAWLYFSGVPCITLLALTIGFRSLEYAMLGIVLFAAAGALLARAAWTPFERTKTGYSMVLATSAALIWVSGIEGPLFGVPSLLVANAVGFLMQPDKRRRPLILALTFAGPSIALAFEAFRLVPPSYVFSNGMMLVTNRLVDLSPWTMLGLLNLGGSLLNAAIGLFFIRFRDVLSGAEERLQVQAWHLRQLVPPS